jgi:creatinine amidohydrolase
MGIAGTITLRSETFLAVVQDVLESVLAQGVRRAVILNGHGGNVSSLDVAASRLGHVWHGKVRIVAVTYFHLAAPRQDEFRQSAMGMGHACEFETSVQLFVHPELVDMSAAVTCHRGINRPISSAPRRYAAITTSRTSQRAAHSAIRRSRRARRARRFCASASRNCAAFSESSRTGR